MRNHKGLYSSESVEWATPMTLFRQLEHIYGGFDLDPCANSENTKCAKYFTKEQDGLQQKWAPNKVFMNPPYGREIGLWVRKAYDESTEGALVVCLLPARTDTKWWHDVVEPNRIKGVCRVEFIRGRVSFGDGLGTAPFPSVIVVFGGRK